MILDTFYVLFKSNADDLKKGGKEAIQTTEKVEKSLKAAENSSTKLGNSFASMIGKASGAFAALFSVGALVSGIFASVEYSSSLGGLSKQLSYSSEELDAWGGAVKEAGGDAQSFYSTVASMDKKLRDSGSTKKFIDMLPNLAKRFEGLSAGKSADLGAKLGLDQGTIMLLQKGGKEIENLIARQKELGLVTKKDTEVAEKFKLQQEDTSHAFRSLFTSMATEILPIFQKVSKIFERVAILLRDHKDVIIGGIIGISAALLGMVNVGKLMNIVFSKWLIIVAVITTIGTAIGLLYEDFKVFRAGGDSVIGDLVKKFPGLGKAIDKVGNIVDKVTDYFKEMGTTPMDLLLDGLNGLIDALVIVYEKGKPVWELLGNIAKAIGFVTGESAEWLGANTDESIKNKSIASDANEITKSNNEKLAKIRGVSEGIKIFDKSPLSTQSSGAITNSQENKNVTNNISIGPQTINTQATDPNAIANAWQDNLNKKTNFAFNNLSSGRAA